MPMLQAVCGGSLEYSSTLYPLQVSFIMTYALQPHQQPGSVGYVNLDFGWRISLGLQCLFGVAFGVGMFFLPETPR